MIEAIFGMWESKTKLFLSPGLGPNSSELSEAKQRYFLLDS